jgi:hypothetical protein
VPTFGHLRLRPLQGHFHACAVWAIGSSLRRSPSLCRPCCRSNPGTGNPFILSLACLPPTPVEGCVPIVHCREGRFSPRGCRTGGVQYAMMFFAVVRKRPNACGPPSPLAGFMGLLWQDQRQVVLYFSTKAMRASRSMILKSP